MTRSSTLPGSTNVINRSFGGNPCNSLTTKSEREIPLKNLWWSLPICATCITKFSRRNTRKGVFDSDTICALSSDGSSTWLLIKVSRVQIPQGVPFKVNCGIFLRSIPKKERCVEPSLCSLSSTVLRGVLIRLYTKFNSSGEYQKSLNSWRLATLNNSVSGRKRIIRRNINTSTYARVAELAQATGLGPVCWRFESSRGYQNIGGYA